MILLKEDRKNIRTGSYEEKIDKVDSVLREIGAERVATFGDYVIAIQEENLFRFKVVDGKVESKEVYGDYGSVDLLAEAKRAVIKMLQGDMSGVNRVSECVDRLNYSPVFWENIHEQIQESISKIATLVKPEVGQIKYLSELPECRGTVSEAVGNIIGEIEKIEVIAKAVISEGMDKELAENVAAPFMKAIGPVMRSVRDASKKDPKNEKELQKVFDAISGAWYDFNRTGAKLKGQ